MATDFTSIEPLEREAQTAENRALQSSSASITLPDKLKQAINSRFSNSPLIKQRETAMQDVLTSAPRARESVLNTINQGTILSPTQQASIIASRRAADVVPLISLNDLLNNQYGSMGDIVDAGTRGYQQIVAADQGAAALSRNRANSALANLISQRELEVKEREANKAAAPNATESLLTALLLGNAGNNMQTPQGLADTLTSDQGVAAYDKVSLKGINEEVPIVGVEPGTEVSDDETGYSYIFDGQFWQPKPQDQGFFSRVSNFLGNFFGGRE
jgi:hypothetical protein